MIVERVDNAVGRVRIITTMNLEIQNRIAELENLMYSPEFWSDKARAGEVLREIEELKNKISGGSTYDKGDAVLSIFTGAGGDDAEDFTRMLYEMYRKYCESKNWQVLITNESPNSIGGYRSISMEIIGKNVYGTLRNESGVHRLVRMSPFNAKGKRNTSFSMVEVLPKFEKVEFSIPETELEMSFARSGGKGGQNVNKRETAVRMTHTPTGLSVHATGRAADIGYKDKATAALWANWLVTNYEVLGIEEVHDYAGTTKKGCEKWGRGWRCNRDGKPGWKDWTETANGGSGGGLWLHVELTPAMADNPTAFVEAWKSLAKPV